MQERESALRALERRRRAARKRKIAIFLRVTVTLILIAAIAAVGVAVVNFIRADSTSGKTALKSDKLNLKNLQAPDYVDVQLIGTTLTHRGVKLKEINSIVIHYTGNPGSTAQNNRDYFNKPTTEVCSHFVVGLEGEIIQCLPLDERSAASNERNRDTISIEVCHPDESGEFNEATYNALIELTAWLCDNSGLDSDDIIRHYDVTGKLCPIYYVENEDKWEQLKADVKTEIESRE